MVGRGTARIGYARGIRSQTTASEIVLTNPGSTTRVLTTGEIVVSLPGGEVVLRLVP